MDSCDILINAGDMLSNSTGVLSIMRGYLDAQTVFAKQKPILNFRGNHEYAGCAPGSYMDVFGTPDFKGYSLNRFGDVCIIGLDVWNGTQKEWLKKAVKHPDFTTAKHRILIAHYPPTWARSRHARTIMGVLDGIFTGKNPIATIDLMISGHLHRGSFTAKNSALSIPINPKGKSFKAEKVPFALYVNEGVRANRENCMTIVEAKGDSLKLKLVRMDGSISKEYKIK